MIDEDKIFRRNGEGSGRSDVMPKAPESVDETGLKQDFIEDLILKFLYYKGTLSGAELENSIRLPYFGVLDKALKELRNLTLVDVKRGISIIELQWEFTLTGKGVERAKEALERNGYVGPAPVPLHTYFEVYKKYSKILPLKKERVKESLHELIFDEDTLKKVGIAFLSAKSAFLYGEPGNGKTSLVEAIAKVMEGHVLVPYAIEVSGQIIRFYDPMHHREIDIGQGDRYDKRWIPIKRPFVEVGGELRLENLELAFNPETNEYLAPLQMKANGGIMLVDDFGRQQVKPEDLLNRWIVPLEKGVDYYNLRTGEQIAFPFLAKVVFSTNLTVSDLVDEAFLRRIPFKIHIKNPTKDLYLRIFKLYCDKFKIDFDDMRVNEFIDRYYANRPMRGSHARDLLFYIKALAYYLDTEPTLDYLDEAAKNLFAEEEELGT